MKLDAIYLPAMTDSVFEAKCKLLRGVFAIDTYPVQRTHTMMRFIYYDAAWCRFDVRFDQGSGMVVGVKWGEAIDSERAVQIVATKYSFAGIAIGCVRRKLIIERQFWAYAKGRAEWFV